MTGQYTARPPHSEKSYVLAVVDDVLVSGTALSPSREPDGGGPCPPCLRGRRHSLPRRKRNRPVMSDCRALDLGSGAPPTERVLGGGTGGVSLLCRAAVIFVFTLRNQFGDDAVRDASQLLHAYQHGGHAYALQGNSFPVSRNEGPRS